MSYLRKIYTALTRIIKSPVYLAAFLFYCCLVVNYHNLVFNALLSDPYIDLTVLDTFILFSAFGGGTHETLFLLSFPILTVTSTVLPVITDMRTRSSMYSYTRMGFSNYYSSNLVASLIAGSLQIATPLILNIVISSLAFPKYTVLSSLNDYSRNGAYHFDLLASNPVLYCWLGVAAAVLLATALIFLASNIVYLLPKHNEYAPVATFLGLILLTALEQFVPYFRTKKHFNYISFLSRRNLANYEFLSFMLATLVISCILTVSIRSRHAKVL